MKVWHNGSMVDPSESLIGKDGWSIGVGIFETIRTENGRPQFLTRHMRRALSGARTLGFSLPAEEDVASAIDMLIENQPHVFGRLRLSFSDGSFLATHDEYIDDRRDLAVATFRTGIIRESPVLKKFPYTQNLELLTKAKAQGVDEFLIIDGAGRFTEGAVSNYAFRITGQWVTAPISQGILAGVIRAIAVEQCGVAVREVLDLEVDQIEAAVAMSSLKIANVIESIDGRPLAIGEDDRVICHKLHQIASSH